MDVPSSIPGKIELAPSFRVLYQDFSESRGTKRRQPVIIGIVVGIVCIFILGAIFRAYFFYSSLRINLNSGRLLCSDVLMALPVFIPSGEILFSQHDESGSTLFLLNPKEHKKESIFHHDSANLFHVFSRDGVTLALTLNSYHAYQIATVTLQSSELSVLTFSNIKSRWPCFSGDGNRIVFQVTRNGRDEIWMMNCNGKKQHPLSWEGRHPDYSPTREEIVFESDVRGISNIFRGIVGEKEIENLTKATKIEDACFSPSFSPDGEWILFHKKGKGLWVMKRDGTKQKQIMTRNFATMMGRISPDGMHLAVCAGNIHSKGNLYLYTLPSPTFGSQ